MRVSFFVVESTPVERRFGIFLQIGGLSWSDLAILGSIVLAALGMGLLPAWPAY